MPRYASTAGRSARDINFENAQRARERRVNADVLNPGTANTAGGATWDPLWGGMDRAEEAAGEAGLGFHADLGGIGRWAGGAPAGGGRLTPTDQEGIAFNVGLGQLTDQNRARLLSDQAVAGKAMDEAVGGLYRSDDQRTLAAAGLGLGNTATDRQTFLSRLPPALRLQVEPAMQKTDIAEREQATREAAQAEVTRANKAKEAEASLLAPITDTKTGAAVTGPEILPKLAKPIATQVQALAEGRMAFPTGAALKAPYWQKMMGLVAQYDPSFDTINYNARASTRKDFTSGKAAGQINAINTVVGHLHDLASTGEQLGNTGMEWANSIYNKLTPGGTTRGVSLNNFETLKEGVANELMRVWRQVGAGSEKEIEDWKATIGATKSPDQLRGAFSTIAGMLESKLGALDSQYKQGMGTDAVSAISPESQQRLNALKKGAPAAAGGGAGPKVGDTVNVGGKRIKISVIHPDGSFDGDEAK